MFRDAGVAEWQTHLTQNQAGNTVWVQVPPPAPTLGGKTFVLPPIFYILSKIFLTASIPTSHCCFHVSATPVI